LNHLQGAYTRAESFYSRASSLSRNNLGADHALSNTIDGNLAMLFVHQGRFSEADKIFRKILESQERTLGFGHPDVANSLINFGSQYESLGRNEIAESFYTRGLKILETVHGTSHPDLTAPLSSLGLLYKSQEKFKDAERILIRCLDIAEKYFGSDNSNTAISLNNLALLYADRGQFSKAGPLYQRSLDVVSKVFGSESLNASYASNNLAYFYADQNRYEEAEPFYLKTLALRKKHLGDEHPETIVSLTNTALFYNEWGKPEVGYLHALKSFNALKYRLRFLKGGLSTSTEDELKTWEISFLSFIEVSIAAGKINSPSEKQNIFIATQLAHSSVAGNAIARMAQRFAKKNRSLSHFIRQQQDIRGEIISLKDKFLHQTSLSMDERQFDIEKSLRAELKSVEHKFSDLEELLVSRAHNFSNIFESKFLSLKEAMKILGPGEAMIFILPNSDRDQHYVTIVKSDYFNILAVPLDVSTAEEAVKILRKDVDF